MAQEGVIHYTSLFHFNTYIYKKIVTKCLSNVSVKARDRKMDISIE